ncbi:MAG: cytidylate kinase-like family protein [Deltaproteobacteria bacterium]|nr:cytidylate kinase-like family protein [Deltaproteobacteria bacterium]
MAIVTISRESGSGGIDIAKAVAKKLNYDYVSKESIYKEIEEHGKKWLEWVADLDERAPSTWERFDKSYAAYLALVEHCVYVNALKNNVVILGRGGNWLLKDIPYVLRVRVIASAEDRARTISRRLGIDMETARKKLKFRDHERLVFYQRAYNRDWTNPNDYNMTLNTSHMSFDESVDRILNQIPATDKFATPENQEMVRRLELASRVKADIITRFPLFIPTLDVIHDGATIVLQGVALCTAEQYQSLLETAMNSAGTTRVRSELTPRGA